MMTFSSALKSALLAILITGAAACNTVEGVGEDIQSVGKAGRKAID
jgi:entericidin B